MHAERLAAARHLLKLPTCQPCAGVCPAGASGAGKTHTLIASNNNLVDRIIDDVFVRYDPRTCTVSVSVEELYRVSGLA